jgi:hypothetical protein
MSGLNWKRDADRRRMRDKGSEVHDGDMDPATASAMYGAPPRKRTPKADQRAELDRLTAEFMARKAQNPQ